MDLSEAQELVDKKIYKRISYCIKCNKPFPSDKKEAVCINCDKRLQKKNENNQNKIRI